jgi:glutamyl-Q tRNA(Asp) synthetase
MSRYVGRFAPSPTGALHAGSLVAALASWLDARAHGGQWLVRIEDVDTPRCVSGADQEILRQLAACGLVPDAAPVVQSRRSTLYQAALNRLLSTQGAYACACSRKDIEAALQARGDAKPRHGELVYPGTCRSGLNGRSARAIRFDTRFSKQNQALALADIGRAAINSEAISIWGETSDDSIVAWHDRRLGAQQQNVSAEVGDFVLRRADGLWAYQLAVVVDDAEQGITHVVRGEDLADNTARQILLQAALGYRAPRYLHTPLVLAADGHKLSKQNGAQALLLVSAAQACAALQSAAEHLALQRFPENGADVSAHLRYFVAQWRDRLSEPGSIDGMQ